MIMEIIDFFRRQHRPVAKPADLIQFEAARDRLKQRSAELVEIVGAGDPFGDMVRDMRMRGRKKVIGKNGRKS